MNPDTSPTASPREKIFNIPPGILFLIILMVGAEIARGFLTEEQDLYVLLTLAVIPIRVTTLSETLPGGGLSIWSSFVTYLFMHGSWAHLIFNGASLLAFGGALEQRLGTRRMLFFFFFCGVLAALGFVVVHPYLYAPMIGASGAISGLLGGLMRIFFSVLDNKQENNLNGTLLSVPVKPLGAALQDPRIQAVTLAFVVLNVASLFGIQDINIEGTIAWEAHLVGYFAGFLLIGPFDVAMRQKK